MANASFGAVPFDFQGDNPFDWPVPDRQNELIVRRAPWGNRTLVQDLGQVAQDFSVPAWMTFAQYAALDAMRLAGTLATLTTNEARSGVLLRQITGVSKDAINDLVTATLVFLVP